MTKVKHSGMSAPRQAKLHRSVGVFGLTMISLGSIIGSGWLLGAYKAATHAGPASLLSWLLATAILGVLALIHAELGTAYPVAGGTARFPAFAFGRLAGFAAGWAAWLQAVTLAPVEVEASLTYLDNIGWANTHLHLLNQQTSTLTSSGLLWGTVLMALFTVINLVGVRFLSESNSITVMWKMAIPLLTIVVLLTLSFHPGNFAAGGGFFAKGPQGVFAALPAGVVFAAQGFEQCIQFGGEARNPQKDISRAILIAMVISALTYILLEVAFIGSLNPADLVHGWDKPMVKGAFGPYATLATAAGAGWLAYILYADALISPAGTALVYLGTASRFTYAQGHAGDLPKGAARLTLRGIPVWGVILAFVIGEVAFLPFPSWQSLVGLITSATAIMYAFAPVSLTALRRRDPERKRPYRLRGAAVIAPIGFIAANLVIYWGGFDTTWKIETGIGAGFLIFAATQLFRNERSPVSASDWKGFVWVPVWLAANVLLGYLGNYDSGGFRSGGGELTVLPNLLDLLVVSAVSLVIYFWAVNLAVPASEVSRLVGNDETGLTEVPGHPVAITT
ncbi:APC family permease [Streptomyces sp. RB6PN25]|uniref:APC family permease n=1 Tax=Streptomyces humicola TaxID=2953240 RepID=A0ABT1Q4I5_9ACTN|nr:APC family permease [Streptomyces humicola]MCQ4084839.1 APC family permease [Streptomyces humicola]